MNEQKSTLELIESGISRRRFFGYAGTLAGVGLVASIAGCKKDDGGTPDTGVDLGSKDTGILNYAYALEQLEAAFYIKVLSAPYISITQQETSYLSDIRDHEVAHREFFKNALGSAAIPALSVDFSSIDFSNRTQVLGAAMAFEDLGVSAYNGAGKLLANVDYLVTAGKIVSVEARHAAIIRNLVKAASFAASDVVSETTGMDMARTPSEVLAIAGKYITTKINASNLPTT